MSKKPFKSQASASRAPTNPHGILASGFGGLGASSSSLSFVHKPPDLSGISTSDVVVIFKNLLKKDATTKAKALEDLQSYISSLEGNSAGVEDGVLGAWIKLYPRTSIDNSRRVRQLAHVIQGQITTLSGRRMLKELPKIIGAWLAGTWDSDRSVSRAAQDSIKDAFPTEEKRRTLIILFAGPVLEYAQDALFHETVQSLSDERIVSLDDAEAKYARVVASSVCVITYILSELEGGNISKVQTQIDELLGNPRLWDFATHKDPFLRRSIYRLLKTSISKQNDLISSSLKTISACVVSKGFIVDQSGSTWDFTDALSILTLAFPTVWTDVYPPKRPAIPRLQQFLKKGSQGGPPGFWGNVEKILLAIPTEVLLQDRSATIKLLEAYQSGMGSSHEPRSNVRPAWISYFSISAHLIAVLPEDNDRKTLVEQCLLPIFEQYLRQTDEKPRWPLATQAPDVCAKGFDTLAQLQLESIQNLLEFEWRRLAAHLVEDIKTSLPEQYKNFAKSQDRLAHEGKRWFSLQKILTENPDQPMFTPRICRETSTSVIEAAIKAVVSRKGRPYGAATIIDVALVECPDLLFSDVSVREEISTFVKTDLPTLTPSPSASTLISILYSYGSRTNYEEEFTTAWTATVSAILSSPDPAARPVLIRDLLQHMPRNATGITRSAQLEAFIIQLVKLALHGESSDWDTVNEALRLHGKVISDNAIDQILSEMVDTLSLGDDAGYALQGFEIFARKNRQLLKSLLQTKKGSEILSRILFLSESTDQELSHHAENVKSTVEALMIDGATGEGGNESMVDIIKNGLTETNPNSISVQSLVSRAQKLLEQSNVEDTPQLADQLVPHSSQWERAIQPFIAVPPKPSLAITDAMAGCIHLVERKSLLVSSLATLEQPRDSSGFSTAIRIASYTAKLLKSNEVYPLLSPAKMIAVFQGLVLVMQLANDNVGLAGANNLWITYSPEVEAEMLDFATEAHDVIVKLLPGIFTDISLHPKDQDLFNGPLLNEGSGDGVTSAQHFYKTRALSAIYSELLELRGFSPKDGLAWMEAVTDYRKNKDLFSSIATINGVSLAINMGRESERLRDRLVSDLSGLDIKMDVGKGLGDLILLNAVLSDLDETATPIPQQRVVFFLKHLISWFDFKTPLLVPERQEAVVAEVAKVLTAVLPQIKGMSDSVWSWSLKFISHLCSVIIDSELSTSAQGLRQEEELPAIHATLKFYIMLTSIRTANAELKESWSKYERLIAKGLTKLLQTSPNVPDDFHQPQKVVNNLLSRCILELPPTLIVGHDEMYTLLNHESRAIQQTGFEVLHRYIPRAQEDISLSAALDKTTVKLPPELISLILEAPAVEDLEDIDFERSMPLSLRGYLLSWTLVLDHFTNASLKVRRDYIEDIREGNYLPGLLYFTLDFLGRNGKMVDASGFDIANYQSDAEDSGERDTQWLLLTLYFRSLVLIPSLTRSWWFNCGRGTVQRVEQFTEKYISPFVIEDTLKRVKEWVGYQTTEEEKKLQVKVSKREVTAEYEVDEQTLRILIRLHPAYPLQQATVDGVDRVGVDERKWQAWLLSMKGVINFSDGSIVDGLQNWRSNIERAFKGQTECAICYSIVSSDKELPTKKCSTCKNLFHSSCLFKWFKSSNAPSCPLCRNSFNFDTRK